MQGDEFQYFDDPEPTDILDDPWARLLATVLYGADIDRSEHHLSVRHANQHTAYNQHAKNPAIKQAIKARNSKTYKTKEISMPETAKQSPKDHVIGSVIKQLTAQIQANSEAIYEDLIMSEARQGAAGGGVVLSSQMFIKKKGPIHTHKGRLGWDIIYHPRVKIAETTYDQDEVMLPGME